MPRKIGYQARYKVTKRYTVVSVAKHIRPIRNFVTLEELLKYCKKNPVEYPLQLDRLIWDNIEKRFIRVDIREELL